VRVTIDVADDVARDSFEHNVLAGEAHSSFSKIRVPLLGATDSVCVPALVCQRHHRPCGVRAV
jgi:hypothetical protein